MKHLTAPLFFVAYIVIVVFSTKKNEEFCKKEQRSKQEYSNTYTIPDDTICSLPLPSNDEACSKEVKFLNSIYENEIHISQ